MFCKVARCAQADVFGNFCSHIGPVVSVCNFLYGFLATRVRNVMKHAYYWLAMLIRHYGSCFIKRKVAVKVDTGLKFNVLKGEAWHVLSLAVGSDVWAYLLVSCQLFMVDCFKI